MGCTSEKFTAHGVEVGVGVNTGVCVAVALLVGVEANRVLVGVLVLEGVTGGVLVDVDVRKTEVVVDLRVIRIVGVILGVGVRVEMRGEQVFSSTDALPGFLLPITKSRLPSPSKSPTATELEVVPAP